MATVRYAPNRSVDDEGVPTPPPPAPPPPPAADPPSTPGPGTNRPRRPADTRTYPYTRTIQYGGPSAGSPLVHPSYASSLKFLQENDPRQAGQLSDLVDSLGGGYKLDLVYDEDGTIRIGGGDTVYARNSIFPGGPGTVIYRPRNYGADRLGGGGDSDRRPDVGGGSRDTGDEVQIPENTGGEQPPPNEQYQFGDWLDRLNGRLFGQGQPGTLPPWRTQVGTPGGRINSGLRQQFIQRMQQAAAGGGFAPSSYGGRSFGGRR